MRKETKNYENYVSQFYYKRYVFMDSPPPRKPQWLPSFRENSLNAIGLG
jgi:hypothetical protein